MTESPFFDPQPEEQVLTNGLCYARWDNHPASKGHMLIVPYREFASYFDATEEERAAIWALVEEVKQFLHARYRPDGYNIGMNIGVAAGQTVMHMHVHVIPRYVGDALVPKDGGIRAAVESVRKG